MSQHGPRDPASVLVVTTYPPIPRAAAAAGLAEVRRAWAEGREATVVSPRISAAHLTVAIHGLLAGRRLDNVRRLTHTTHLVLVIEDGFPFSSPRRLRQLGTAAVLARVMGRFDYVRLVRVGDPQVTPTAMARLEAVSDEVVDGVAGANAPGVTPLGPVEVPASQRPRQIASIAARRVLGSKAPAVRARLGAVRRRFIR